MSDAKKNVLIIGGGPAGMMAAIQAARAGAAVTLLDGKDRPGKKLLLTGNGRCNLTNLDPKLQDRYYGTGGRDAGIVFKQFSPQETLQFFREIGLLTQEKNGYVYPFSNQSVSVLQVLLAELRRLKVKTKFGEKVTELLPSKEKWLIRTSSWHYEADAVVAACGSKAVSSTGSDGSGYALAKTLGHSIIPVYPALTGLFCGNDYPSALCGVRCLAKVSLLENEREIITEKGELQWGKNGISGIVIFQISRFVSTSGNYKSLKLLIDLLPDWQISELSELLYSRLSMIPEERCSSLLAGFLNEKLIPVLLKRSELSEKQVCRSIEKKQINVLLTNLKRFALSVTGVRDFESCQVCAGGIDCREINFYSMESTLHEGLFFAGEILDTDGPCGGYNLQWAWSSGTVAGRHAGGNHDHSNQ